MSKSSNAKKVIPLRADSGSTASNVLKLISSDLNISYVVFDISGVVQHEFSETWEIHFGNSPEGCHVLDLIGLKSEQKENFEDWVEAVFTAGHLQFETLIKMIPQSIELKDGRGFEFSFLPITEPNGDFRQMVLLAKDRTQEHKVEHEIVELDQEKERIVRIVQNRNHFLTFVRQTRGIIFRLQSATPDRDLLEVERILHTIKGASDAFHITSMKEVAIEFEDEIEHSKKAGLSKETLAAKMKIFGSILEDTLNKLIKDSESFLGMSFEKSGAVKEIQVGELKKFAKKLEVVDEKSGTNLADDFVSHLVAVPIRSMMEHYFQEMFDLGELLGKKIAPVHFIGEEIPVLPEIYAGMFSSMIHIFRNIADHGIETTSQRVAVGKDIAGKIKVKVKVDKKSLAHTLLLEISDDGSGIDPKKIRRKLEESHPNEDWSQKADKDIIQHIFDPWLTTQDVVTDISGRGVGLDAVRDAVATLGGEIWVESTVGKGTCLSIRVPYALSFAGF